MLLRIPGLNPGCWEYRTLSKRAVLKTVFCPNNHIKVLRQEDVHIPFTSGISDWSD